MADPRGPQRAAPRPARNRRRPVRWGLRIAGGLAVLVITASGLGHALVDGISGSIGRVDAFGGMQGRPSGSKGTNFLLVGTDGRDGIDPREKKQFHLGGAPCHCTDTIMLVHLSQDRQRATVVSIPRDTYLRLPDATTLRVSAGSRAGRSASAAPGGSPEPPGATPTAVTGTHPAKINQAYALGGPKLTVRTVEQLTGVHIDHYLEVDFTSFMKTVDVIGGVQVCTAVPLKDSFSGLNLPVGTTRLDGGQALQYVRSRHVDGTSDLGRMQRQQRFLAQVIHKMTSGNVLSNPLELSRVASTVLGSVRADQGLSSTDLISLAQGMKDFSPSSSEYVSVPLSVMNYNVPGIGSTVKWDAAKAGKLWAAVRADQPLTAPRPKGSAPHHAAATPVDVDPATISVRVANGTATNGLGGSTQQALHATGFATPGTATTAHQRSARTVIQYDPRWDRSARTLAAALPGAQLQPAPGQGPVMKVTVGADFTKVDPVAMKARPQPPGTAVTGDQEVCP
ncbi:LCP family protein [Streptomyces sp. NPDC020917]|uniref:LCP family protein n=1 Tax=Streptomyces sp. NPDC020917 TaxID=3365102 RepID=UPI00378E740B